MLEEIYLRSGSFSEEVTFELGRGGTRRSQAVSQVTYGGVGGDGEGTPGTSEDAPPFSGLIPRRVPLPLCACVSFPSSFQDRLERYLRDCLESL